MTRRLTLTEIDYYVVEELADGEWRSVDYFTKALGLGGSRGWYRVALVCERAAADGYLELRAKPGSGRRWFRKAQA